MAGLFSQLVDFNDKLNWHTMIYWTNMSTTTWTFTMDAPLVQNICCIWFHEPDRLQTATAPSK